MVQSAGKVRGLVAFIVVLGSAATLFAQTATDRAPKDKLVPLVGSEAPNFSLRSLDGSEMSLRAWRGQVVLVNFWATWCLPCRTEMPEIEAAYQAHRSEGLTVLAINQGEDKETVARFVQEFRLTFPVLLDSDGAVVKRYDVRGLPASFFIDREGVIYTIRSGELNLAFIESQLATHIVPGASDLTGSMPTAGAAATSPGRLNMDEFFPLGEGRDLVVETCLSCHDVLTFGWARKTRDGWLRSRANHADRFRSLSDAEVETMYGYLAMHMNPDIPISQQLPPGYSCGT